MIWRVANLKTVPEHHLPDYGHPVLLAVQWSGGKTEVEIGSLEEDRDNRKRYWFIRRLGRVSQGEVLYWTPIPEIPKGLIRHCPNCDYEFIDASRDS